MKENRSSETVTEPLSAHALSAQIGPAYDAFSQSDRAEHCELLGRIERPEDVEVAADRQSDGRWRVTVCSADRVGILSIIAGLFTAYRIDILSGDVFTVRSSSETAPRRPTRGRRRAPTHVVSRRILDIFYVRAPGELSEHFWEQFRTELASIIALLAGENPEQARDRVIDRVSETVRAEPDAATPLLPITVELDNESSPASTQLRIHSTDTRGFLFEFTSALAMLSANIDRVEIRTVDGEVRDTFWVTDASGRKITNADRLHELRVAAVLIKQFTHLLPQSPNPAQALRQFSALTRQMVARPDWTADLRRLESNDAVLGTIAELMGVSQFLWEDFLRMQHENLFPVLRDVPALDRAKSKGELGRELAAALRRAGDHAERVAELNRYKDREMFRIDLRHITGRVDFVRFAAELTELAEVIVERAVGLCHEQLEGRLGVPMLSDGRPCAWCVAALGKFGGRELGYASDIELIFIYEGDGKTRVGGRARPQAKSSRRGELQTGKKERPDAAGTSNSRYFEELVSEFLRTLAGRREGIFEIDLRLRPYGKAGTLACSLDGFAAYFSDEGSAEQFERMALVRLRPVAGDAKLAGAVERLRDRFVYSGRPLDRSNIRHLRQRQATELVPAGEISAKHSPGGLVDIEYFVQAKQIDSGSRDHRVRTPNTLDAIDRLRDGGHIATDLADRLRETYAFLRRLIDALRVVRGHAKDLTLPPSDSRAYSYLARRLKYDSADRLRDELRSHMAFAERLWATPDP